jgi:dihydropteroate synthase type 2
VPPIRIVGVVNITEDSFSDGGLYLEPDAAIAHAQRLRADGADVIELGAASSHPDAKRVSAGEEGHRLTPVLEALAAAGVPVSVDSTRPEIHGLALAHGAAYLNDVRGFPDPGAYGELSASECRLVVVHSIEGGEITTRVKTDPATIWDRIDAFFEERLDALHGAGVAHERLILDPGLGFFLGANPEPSVAVLASIDRLRTRFDAPVLVSPSRKSFLRALTGRGVAEIGSATLAAELHAAQAGVDFIRTHDVGALRDALVVNEALTGATVMETHKAIARAVFDVWNEGGLERLDPLIDPDVVHHDPYDPRGAHGLAGMKETVASVRSRYRALRLTVEDQIAERDRVATRWSGELESGREIIGITIDRFEEGKIVEAWRSMVPLTGSEADRT